MDGNHEMNDTSPEIAEQVRQKLMTRSGSERFLMGVRMFDAARGMVIASLPPGLSDPEKKRLIYRRIYGEPLPF